MKYRLVAIDLDDSLLNDDLSISQENLEAVRCTIEKGVKVTIATGRMFKSALPYVQQLGINVPVITYQGALVVNALSRDVLLHCPVPLDLSREIVKESKKNNIHLQVYIDDEYYFEEHNKYSDLYFKVSGIPGKAVGSLDDFLVKEPTKLIMIDEPENILKWMEYYREKFSGKLQVTISKAHYLEFTNIEATKGNAVKYLAEMYGIKPEEVIAIGDSFNDIPMLTYAGLGVAMGNAPEIVKSHADYVTYSNNENGVAYVLEKFVLGGRDTF
ncbi:Cof subfamily protein (haloacid dehalogenase superfamily) [Caldicoprobacter guelmensis]|uniref:Cof-type HAD-IIB family hydrolase n=1 Tax=Caldicoprobacter guelmensis TaxID=1170224 RepID=UPI00195CA11C|nr:Cof-type HAD-IIB family hydrolase [Caldicoprobacter guelmensis]MBM7581559.1 Cof subfamily protein (haloacid dehalogenase superfamily) [Caldicoprobacter guelmensis]